MDSQPWFAGVFDADYLAIYHRLQDPARAEREAWEIVKALEVPAGGAVLDCPCGFGRHALVLARAGYRVTGVDRAPVFLERARVEQARLGVDAAFVEADMRELPADFSSRFDAAFSAFTSFGYFETDEENGRVLAELARSVKPGGRVLVELVNHLQVLKDLRPKSWFRGEGCMVLEEVAYDWRTDQITNRREVYFDDGRRRTIPPFRIRAYKPCDLVRLAQAAGLRPADLAGGYDGRVFDPLESHRMVLLAERA